MVLFNHSTRELTAKIVFYGPGLCGKTTNLKVLHEKLEKGMAGRLLSLSTAQDRTIYFDLLPVELGNIKGYTVRFQLATVPGQVFYNETRKLVLRGVDGVVFVVDSQWSMLSHNLESFHNLKENLKEAGLSLEALPLVIQYNKRDLPGVLGLDALQTSLGFADYPYVEAVASDGRGVVETFKLISKLTFVDLLRRLQKPGGLEPESLPFPNFGEGESTFTRPPGPKRTSFKEEAPQPIEVPPSIAPPPRPAFPTAAVHAAPLEPFSPLTLADETEPEEETRDERLPGMSMPTLEMPFESAAEALPGVGGDVFGDTMSRKGPLLAGAVFVATAPPPVVEPDKPEEAPVDAVPEVAPVPVEEPAPPPPPPPPAPLPAAVDLSPLENAVAALESARDAETARGEVLLAELAEARDLITTLTARAEALEALVAAKPGTEPIDSLAARIAALEGPNEAVGALERRLGDLERRPGFDAAIASVRQRLDSLEEGASSNSGLERVDELAATIETLRQEMQKGQEHLAERLDPALMSVAGLRTALEDARLREERERSSLKAGLSLETVALGAAIEDTRRSIASLPEALSALREEASRNMDGLRSAVDESRQRGDRAEERAAGLERRLDELDGTVSSLGPLASHPARIAAVEARLESLADELSRHRSSMQGLLSARGEESAQTEKRLAALTNDLATRIDGAASAVAEAADTAARHAAAGNAAIASVEERIAGLESRLEDARRGAQESQSAASAAAEAMQALETRLLERIAKTEGRSRATAEALRRALDALDS